MSKHTCTVGAVTDYIMEGARNVLGALPLEQQRGRTPGAAIQARIAPYNLCSMLGLWKSIRTPPTRRHVPDIQHVLTC